MTTRPDSRPPAAISAPSILTDTSPADNDFPATPPARVTALPPRLKLAPTTVTSPAADPTSTPVMLPYAPPPAPTKAPVGGATAGGGGIGSPAPHVIAAVELLTLAFLTLILGRLPLDLTPWRATLLASHPEHPD